MCFVVLRNKKILVQNKAIRTYLLRNSPTHMIPEIVFTSYIPLLSNGKTDRQQLLKMYQEQLLFRKYHNIINLQSYLKVLVFFK